MTFDATNTRTAETRNAHPSKTAKGGATKSVVEQKVGQPPVGLACTGSLVGPGQPIPSVLISQPYSILSNDRIKIEVSIAASQPDSTASRPWEM